MTARETVRRGDVTLSALATGRADGPALLLSNSLGAGLGMWAPQRAAFEAHYRVIGYDTRGHGHSSAPDGPYSFDDLVADAIAVLDHFGVAQADYIGLSLGGMTGLGLGLNHPDRFGKIVCACARADAPPPFVQSWDDRVAAIEAGGMAAIWPGTLDRWLTPDVIAAEPALVDQLAADFTATSVKGYAGCAGALKGLDYKRHLTKMPVPVLYVAGAKDMGAPAAEMNAMWVATVGSDYVEIPDCAHIANLNRPDAFTDAVRDFLLA